jgi:hypothetical protein
MIVPDIQIPKLAKELRRLQQDVLTAIDNKDKNALELTLKEQTRIIDLLIELGNNNAPLKIK